MEKLWLLQDRKGNSTIPRWQDQMNIEKSQIITQLMFSIPFGLAAFLSFCILRPRWTQLYNARKKQSKTAKRLPDLPKSMFGWIPVLYRISREEVLASAGLDAFVFLSFFRFAINYLSITLFFALTVILPVNYRYTGEVGIPGWPPSNHTGHKNSTSSVFLLLDEDSEKSKTKIHTGYLWMYVAFSYFFTLVALWLLVDETKYIIRIRQAFLGTQNTITDRTIKLSGIPTDLRSEEGLTKFIEDLNIGKVDNIMLCRDWTKLDSLMDERMACLRRLEEAWTRYVGIHSSARHPRRGRRSGREDADQYETTALLTNSEIADEQHLMSDNERPKHTIRYGFLNLWSREIDAIDYYEEKLRRLDERIMILRKEEFRPTPIAFVTMETTAACQMAAQARLDPVPGRLLATQAPAPADVLWRNTYLSRHNRMVRSWTVMTLAGLLTIFWVLLLIPPAALISDEVLEKIFPGFEDPTRRRFAQWLVRTGATTLYFTLVALGVPYLYYWLSTLQGMISQGDIELSVVSKNFFFTFFNLFIVFTIFGSAGTFYDFYKELQDALRDTSKIAYAIAKSLESIWPFYANLIILQGFGLFPFRLLEFGTVFCYPFYLINARTPRDHAELTQAPIFQYGFYLPQSMLVFVICTVYSVLPASWLIILFGLIYFLIGSFVYKYQLLYAMEHSQHSTGKAWPMICNRIIIGLVIFHIAMTGLLALRQALSQALFMAPLLVSTIWFTIYFQRAYFPLMNFIALRSIGKDGPPPLPRPSESAWERATDNGRTVDTDPDTGLRYMNPNLTQPLERMWVRKGLHTARAEPEA